MLKKIFLILSLIYSKKIVKSIKINEDKYIKLFKEFKINFNKTYNKDIEDQKFKIFKDNVIFIEKFNQNKNEYTLKINSFTDLTFEEFNNSLKGKFNNLKDQKEDKFDRNSTITYKNIDYSDKINENKNKTIDFNKLQYNQLIDLIDSNYFIDQNNKIQFSEKFIEDCIEIIKSTFIDVSKYSKNNGLIENGSYENNNCKIDKFSSKINDYKIYQLKTYDDLFRILNSNKLVLIPIYINQKLMFYDDGIFNDDNNECNEDPNFYLLLYGIYYKDNNYYYLKFKSLLGNSWGNNGSLKIKFSKNDKANQGICSIFTYKSFLIEF